MMERMLMKTALAAWPLMAGLAAAGERQAAGKNFPASDKATVEEVRFKNRVDIIDGPGR